MIQAFSMVLAIILSNTFKLVQSTRASSVLPPSLFVPSILSFSTSKRSSSKRMLFSSVSSSSKEQEHDGNKKHIVLVGGGHAHVQVIKALRQRPKNIDVTLIDIQNSAWYSGMIPGCVSKLYEPKETQIHLKPLCKWSNIQFYGKHKVLDIDPERNILYVQPLSEDASNDNDNAFTLNYDVVSFDIGSSSKGPSTTNSSWKNHVIATRPIWELISKLEKAEKEEGSNEKMKDVLVVGGGAAGIELAMALRSRWKDTCNITILDSGSKLLPSENDKCRHVLIEILKEKNINVEHNIYVDNVHAKELSIRKVVPRDGTSNDNYENKQQQSERRSFTHCLWAAGATGHALTRNQMKKRSIDISDEDGWIRVSPTLQSLSHSNIFAAGDCATIMNLPNNQSSPPKAGVYAVRCGPILIDNLLKYVQPSDSQHNKLTSYKPQGDFLKLIMCGDGTALGFRFGLPLQGRWVWQLKDSIDQKFVNLFKEETLEKEKEEQACNNKQYDDDDDDQTETFDPMTASELLQRTDDNVDYQIASKILKQMRDDEDYRKQVLEKILAKQSTKDTFLKTPS